MYNIRIISIEYHCISCNRYYVWAESAASGLAGVFGIIAFFIGYALSVEVTIAPRDFWVNSAFGIFIKKLGVANMTAFAVWFIGNLIIG